MIDTNILAQLGVGAYGMFLMYKLLKDDITMLREENEQQTKELINLNNSQKTISKTLEKVTNKLKQIVT